MNLTAKVIEYYKKRGLKNPNVWEALGWMQCELSEVYECLFSFSGGWVRNNPDKHPPKTKEDLAEELGDAIFMLIVAGIVEGVDPIEALEKKMEKKLSSINSELQVISQEEVERLLSDGNTS